MRQVVLDTETTGLEVEQQRGISIRAQSRGGEDRAFQAVRRFFCQYAARRPSCIFQVIRDGIEKFLNAVRIFQAAQLAQFPWSEAGVIRVHVSEEAIDQPGKTNARPE